MKKKSVSTLIYFQEKTRKKNLVKRPKHYNKERRFDHVVVVVKVLVATILLGLAGWTYFKYRPLDIANVEVTGANRFVSKADVNKIAQEKALGRNIVLFDQKSLESVIFGNFLATKTVKVIKVLPDTLRIELTERTPIALLLSENSKDFYFVDSDGFVLGKADKTTTNLPTINYNQQLEVGKFIEAGIVTYYFNLIKALDENGVLVSTISSYLHYTQFYTEEETQALFTNAQNPKPQVKVFAKMMEAFKTEGKKVRKIDLRFDKVIVEFVN